ncbi:MAG: HAD family hydrolase [Candidatus Izemoplasmatales bacterium]|jgi:FMN phosphatase YigB (HAD superfamily)
MFETIMFDLDGTLLPLDEDKFINLYFGGLAKIAAQINLEHGRFMDALASGVKAMLSNDGGETNYNRFWKTFCTDLNLETAVVEQLFLEYYLTDFKKCRVSSWNNPLALPLIRFLKQKGKRIILATNPLFPLVAIRERMSWINLEIVDFSDITTYENSSFSKPKYQYYQEIIQRHALDVNQTLMIGNDASEDMIAGVLGVKTYLVTDCLKNEANLDLTAFRRGSFQDLDTYLRSTVK